MGSRVFGRTGLDSKLSPLAFLAAVAGAGCADLERDESMGSARRAAALECDPSSPVYVDPSAAREGDGSSWASPLRSVQAAIEGVATRGGGEVWVRASEETSGAIAVQSPATLIALRDGVNVFGGFSGTESTVEERDPSLSTTIVNALAGADRLPFPLITGASEATLDGFTVLHHYGATLLMRSVTNFHVANLAVRDALVDRGSPVDVADSSGTFENLRVTASSAPGGVAGLMIAGSDVTVTESEFRGLLSEFGDSAGIDAASSRLVLDRVWFAENRSRQAGKASALRVTSSDVFVTDSVWKRNSGDRGGVVVADSRFVAVNSHWEGHWGPGPAIRLEGTSAWFLNSSFVDNSSEGGGTISAFDTPLELVNTSFADNRVFSVVVRRYVPSDVSVSGEGASAIFNSYSNAGTYSTLPLEADRGNCVNDGVPYRHVDSDVTQVFLQPEFGCLNGGDDAAARRATEQARTFAESLGATFPLDDEWWATSTSTTTIPSDSGPIDPGRHYAPPPPSE